MSNFTVYRYRYSVTMFYIAGSLKCRKNGMCKDRCRFLRLHSKGGVHSTPDQMGPRVQDGAALCEAQHGTSVAPAGAWPDVLWLETICHIPNQDLKKSRIRSSIRRVNIAPTSIPMLASEILDIVTGRNPEAKRPTVSIPAGLEGI